VDWWIIIKIPTLNESDGSGFEYAYADVNNPSLELSSITIDESNGAVWNTLQQIYSNYGSDSVAYVLYNDQTPDGTNHESSGHTKGDLCFDKEMGFWLVHSVPEWPNPSNESYNYPKREAVYGQSFLCVTYGIEQFNSIGSQLLVNKPFIFDSNFPSAFSKVVPNIDDALQGNFITKQSINQSYALSSNEGNLFTSFAKNSKWDNYLYEGFVEPYFNTGFYWETWMNGAHKNDMPSFCQPTYAFDSINIEEITIQDLSWKYTKDHVKWGISESGDIYCIGDINRQYSQSARAGGTVCSSNSNIWNSFNSMISNRDTCK